MSASPPASSTGTATAAPSPAPAAAPAAAPAPPPPPPPKPTPPFVLDVDSQVRRYWDVVQFVIVCFIGAEVPLRIGFSLNEWRSWAAVDVIVNVLLLVDIALNIVTSFEQEGEAVRDRSVIWWRYFKGWFFFDVLSVFPSEIIAAFGVQYTSIYECNRLIRFLRIPGYFAAWERDSSIKPTVIRLVKSAFAFLYYCHFLGCIFYLIADIEVNYTSDWAGQSNIAAVVPSLTSRYFRAWYWGMCVMAGFNNSNPTSIAELIFNLWVTTSGVMFFGTIIGGVGDMVTNLDSTKIYFRSKMDEIDDYMEYKKLPTELKDDVRAYYNYLWKSGKALEKNDLLRDLPRFLKNKMNLFLNREIVAKVPLFKQCADDEKFITALVMCLKGLVCLPNFYVVRKGEIGTEMYFISRGELNVVTDEGVVVFTLRDGGFFGEIALLYDTKRTATIVSRTYCDMFILTKDDFKKVLKQFPEQSKGIKEIAKERFQKIVDDEKKKEATAAAERAKSVDLSTSSALVEATRATDKGDTTKAPTAGQPESPSQPVAIGSTSFTPTEMKTIPTESTFPASSGRTSVGARAMFLPNETSESALGLPPPLQPVPSHGGCDFDDHSADTKPTAAALPPPSAQSDADGGVMELPAFNLAAATLHEDLPSVAEERNPASPLQPDRHPHDVDSEDEK